MKILSKLLAISLLLSVSIAYSTTTSVYLINKTSWPIIMPKSIIGSIGLRSSQDPFYRPTIKPGEKKLLFRVSRIFSEKKNIELEAYFQANKGKIKVEVESKQKFLKNDISHNIELTGQIAGKLKHSEKYQYQFGDLFKNLVITIF